jgi:hypothetical protein
MEAFFAAGGARVEEATTKDIPALIEHAHRLAAATGQDAPNNDQLETILGHIMEARPGTIVVMRHQGRLVASLCLVYQPDLMYSALVVYVRNLYAESEGFGLMLLVKIKTDLGQAGYPLMVIDGPTAGIDPVRLGATQRESWQLRMSTGDDDEQPSEPPF